MAECMTGAYFCRYLSADVLNRAASALVKRLRNVKHKFDAVAFRGMSGALVAPIIASKLKKHIIMVRKPNDGSHSSYACEGHVSSKAYIIVDDFISGGHTCKTVIDTIQKWQKEHGETLAECYAIALYNQSGTPYEDDVQRMFQLPKLRLIMHQEEY